MSSQSSTFSIPYSSASDHDVIEPEVDILGYDGFCSRSPKQHNSLVGETSTDDDENDDVTTASTSTDTYSVIDDSNEQDYETISNSMSSSIRSETASANLSANGSEAWAPPPSATESANNGVETNPFKFEAVDDNSKGKDANQSKATNTLKSFILNALQSTEIDFAQDLGIESIKEKAKPNEQEEPSNENDVIEKKLNQNQDEPVQGENVEPSVSNEQCNIDRLTTLIEAVDISDNDESPVSKTNNVPWTLNRTVGERELTELESSTFVEPREENSDQFDDIESNYSHSSNDKLNTHQFGPSSKPFPLGGALPHGNNNAFLPPPPPPSVKRGVPGFPPPPFYHVPSYEESYNQWYYWNWAAIHAPWAFAPPMPPFPANMTPGGAINADASSAHFNRNYYPVPPHVKQMNLQQQQQQHHGTDYSTLHRNETNGFGHVTNNGGTNGQNRNNNYHRGNSNNSQQHNRSNNGSQHGQSNKTKNYFPQDSKNPNTHSSSSTERRFRGNGTGGQRNFGGQNKWSQASSKISDQNVPEMDDSRSSIVGEPSNLVARRGGSGGNNGNQWYEFQDFSSPPATSSGGRIGRGFINSTRGGGDRRGGSGVSFGQQRYSTTRSRYHDSHRLQQQQQTQSQQQQQ